MTAVIIDDETACHDSLNLLLPYIEPPIEVLGSAFDVRSGLELIRAKQPQILFLDVEMPDGTGFDLLEKIDYDRFAIVFITAHNKYALLAIDFAAMAYIQKPVDSEKLSKALSKAKERLLFRDYLEQRKDLREISGQVSEQRLPNRIAVSNSEGIHYVPINEIAYLTVQQGCTEIHQTNGQRVAVSSNLVEYEKRFALYRQFMRVHRSYIVNLEQVGVCKPDGEAVLRTGQVVPVSNLRLEELKSRLAAL
jgi:two-component system, LytTR family, response regulator